MATDKPTRKPPMESMADEESNAIVYQGASLSQLVSLFKQDMRKVKMKIADLEPVGQRNGYPIYSVKEAARYLVEPIWPIDEYIKRMNHADLPMLLRKEYWAGMRSRQLYEIAQGDLWPTDRVIEHLSDVFKSISMSMRLAADAVERETALTPKQRAIVVRLMDDALANAHEALQKKYEDRKPKDAGADSGHDQAEDDEL